MSGLFGHLPKYIQIKESLHQEIDDGTLSVGQQLPSESVLIDRFGASKMTVIRALQELVQEGYLRRIQGKGTYVTHPKKNAPLIGVLVPRTDQGIFSVVLHSIEKRVHQLGYEMILCSTTEDTSKVATFADRIIARHAAGVIAVPLERVPDPSCNLAWFNQFHQENIPVVLLDRGIEEAGDVPLVHTNNEEAMNKLTRQVLEKGHRRILLVRWEEIFSTTTDARVRGFLTAATADGMKAELAEVITVSDQKTFLQSVEEFEAILYDYEPTAVMCLNDLIAIHVYTLLKAVSESVGANVSVTGFDDLPFTQAIGLTTVHQPLEEEGKEAVDMLHRMIQGGKGNVLALPSHIVTRTSLAPVS